MAIEKAETVAILKYFLCHLFAEIFFMFITK